MTTQDAEQQATDMIVEIGEFATGLLDRLARPDGYSIKPGSVLDADDSLSDPYQVSYAARTCIAAAVDHLHALCSLVLKTGYLHIAAPASVARGALECSSTALWLLSPAASDERIRRGLRWYMQDMLDGNKAATEGGLGVLAPLQDRKDEIEAAADAHGIPYKAIKDGYSSTEVVKAAQTHLQLSLPMDELLIWRLCSGFAHGRAWPMLAFAKAVAHIPTADPNITMIKKQNTYQRVSLLVTTAAITVKGAVALYDKLGTAP